MRWQQHFLRTRHKVTSLWYSPRVLQHTPFNGSAALLTNCLFILILVSSLQIASLTLHVFSLCLVSLLNQTFEQTFLLTPKPLSSLRDPAWLLPCPLCTQLTASFPPVLPWDKPARQPAVCGYSLWLLHWMENIPFSNSQPSSHGGPAQNVTMPLMCHSYVTTFAGAMLPLCLCQIASAVCIMQFIVYPRVRNCWAYHSLMVWSVNLG